MPVQNSPSRVTFRECLAHGAILAALLIVVYPGTFFRGEYIVPAGHYFEYPPWDAHKPAGWQPVANETTIDFMMHFQLYYALTKAALAKGEWPLWNPVQNLGMPLLANYQSRVLYPPRLLHALLELNFATTLYMLLRAWLCGATAYLCGRGIGLGVPGARFFSVGWMLAGYNMLWLYWPLPDVAAWLPILLLGAEWIAQTKYRKGFFAVALGGTLMLLAGHPETAFTMGTGVGGYLVLRLAFTRASAKEWGRALGLAALAWGPALIVSAAQLLPFAEYVANSYLYNARAEGDAWIRYTRPRALIALFVPRYFGANASDDFWGWPNELNATDVSSLYPGILVWVGLGALGVVGLRERVTKARALALTVPSVFFALLATNTPVVSALHDLPLLNTLWRNYWFAFPLFALPLMGALGVDRWFGPRRSTGDTRSILIVSAVIVAAVFLLVGMVEGIGPSVFDDGDVGASAVEILKALLWLAIGTAAFAVSQEKRRIVAAILPFILAADLGFAARNLHPTAPRTYLAAETELIPYLQNLPQPSRVLQFSLGTPSGLMPAFGIEQLLGAEFLYPERSKAFFERANEAGIWEKLSPLCAVDHQLWRAGTLQTTDQAAKLELVTTLDGVDVFRDPAALPRAFLVRRVETVADVNELYERMAQPSFDPRTTAITERPPSSLPSGGEGEPGAARITSRTNTRMTIEVDANYDTVLVVSETYYPGWYAEAGGNSADIFPVYFAFRGVSVPAGNHEVVITYRPRSFYSGLLISVTGMVLACAASLVLIVRQRVRR